MADPAKLLYDQLNSWKVKNNETTATIRSLNTKNGWEQQRLAAQRLLDVEELLHRLRDDGSPMLAAERHLSRWTQMVFGYPKGWTTNGADNLHADSLDVLLTASGTFSIYIPKFEKTGPSDLDNFLDAILAHLKDDSTYLADHARRIIAHLKKLLVDWQALGEFRITDAVKDLERILDELAKKEPQDPFWRRARDATWAWFKKDVMLGAITGATIVALQSGAQSGAEIVQEHVQHQLSSSTQSELSEGADDSAGSS
ncbi:hypothetical protein [Corynebacterium kalidii]|uniref:Uncharacterized protein n=1 Tax=Corynebacterium kalidii TaxID=2931982 RepID=A0A9X1WME0_9CORY|nr:hypothetical protein [Corynebacterium kalidii]MCJ7859232.1 hypothetical protein [Corynebacterium kalidii]